MSQLDRQVTQHTDKESEKGKHNNVPILNHADTESGPASIDHVVSGANFEKYDAAFIRKTMRRVDFRLVPILALAYAISLIDRTNISLARSAGMNIELQLSVGNRYSVVVIAFFPPYIAFELLSQMGLRKFGAARWLGAAVFLWGIVMIGMGFVKTWEQLTGTRALLGIFEAALFPGAAFLLSCWYLRSEVQVRLTYFYLIAAVASGFSSIIAYGLSLLNGREGISGWRWIFIIEGVATCFIGLLAWWLIVDFPHKATFLKPEEKAMVLSRIERERADATPDALTWAKVGGHACDIKLWLYAAFFMCSTLGASALQFFLPVILASLGYRGKQLYYHFIPPYVVVAPIALAGAYFADRTGYRSPVIIFNATLLAVGLALVAFVKDNDVRYFGVFLGVAGCNANVPAVISHSQVNIRQQSKRAYTSALIVAGGGLGGILSALVFREKDAKTGYRLGIWFTIGAQIFTVLGSIGLALYHAHRNRLARKGQVILEGLKGFFYQL
ncbi:unnamed protein product [Tilletia controversa]|uniref:Major facilitator superfamily (MFS) profile domain-containing protein n=1 Tax=Tilletia controversa TaxID=13291 RepID=A0A8X7MX14_9BASI|nr:hypothetical protein A4X06_0g2129 [Tilletia controversa]CAD6923836.1 unnamed protein product [Tilletia controversa]CAD6985378.1 unnamed protein product [Tilletia controversa]